MNILQQFKPIKLIVMDVDGVLTDGKILLLESLEMARNMHVKDGYAMQLAIKKGYQIVIISGATDGGAVSHRLKKLGINEVHQGIKDKATLLSTIINKGDFTKEQVLFIGDDIPDYHAMKLVGLACCPADAVSEIKSISNYISPLNGGEGCVRDIIEKVLKLNGHWDLDTTVTSK